MKKQLATLSCLAVLSGCTPAVEEDGTYRNIKQMTEHVEGTAFMQKYDWECTPGDKDQNEISAEENGYVTGTCNEIGNETVAVSLLLAVSDKGEQWMKDYPLLDAMPETRAALKGPHHNWQVHGETERLEQLKNDLDGFVYKGGRDE